jgi:hypothetical protein
LAAGKTIQKNRHTHNIIKFQTAMKKSFTLMLVLSISVAPFFYSCKKSSTDSGGGPTSETRVSSYKMYQDTNLYESWVNTYTGNLLTSTKSKAYYNGYISHYKNIIDYKGSLVSAITGYDSTGTGWIKNNDLVVTSYVAGDLPSEIIFTFYEVSGEIHQRNKTQYTYIGGQVSERIQSDSDLYKLILYQRTEFTYQDARLVKEETFNQDSSLYSTLDISWQNNLVVQEHCSMPTVFINYKTLFTYSAGRLTNITRYNDDTPTIPDITEDYSYDQNGCLVSYKNTIISTSQYDLWLYSYEPGHGNIREVFEIGDSYYDNWNGNPKPYPSKMKTRIPGFPETWPAFYILSRP